jgi:hypothetical protein
MRKTFAPFDDVLIERLFQPVSNLVADRIGVGPGAAACFCIDIASLSWIVSRVGALSDAVATWDAGPALLDMVVLLVGLVALVSLRTVFRRASGKQANPLRLMMQPHRAIVLAMMIARVVQWNAASVADAADLGMLLFAASALYLGACAEPPPVRRGVIVFAGVGVG